MYTYLQNVEVRLKKLQEFYSTHLSESEAKSLSEDVQNDFDMNKSPNVKNLGTTMHFIENLDKFDFSNELKDFLRHAFDNFNSTVILKCDPLNNAGFTYNGSNVNNVIKEAIDLKILTGQAATFCTDGSIHTIFHLIYKMNIK